ncbi:L,D-transpeptidase [Kitasatospora sp. NA04385]|uniref:L,D-transpeptidase n=1 Tax=Kitasatospora sp. NA04385 TaxID=2742135 RepID=UPI001590176C|nr:L,D-transpeptidase [Kitasatospora sp. NA04385]QKW20802.1 L,D-transpeptidase [Kitasatospora sp. NA04385]
MPDHASPETDDLSAALRHLVADVPSAVPLPPAEVHRTGIRRRRRRRAVLGSAAVLAAGVVIAGGLRYGTAPQPSAPAPAAASPSPTAGRTGAAVPGAVIDTDGHRLTVTGKDGRVTVLGVTAGRPGNETPSGRMTVQEKLPKVGLFDDGASGGPESVTADWCVRLVRTGSATPTYVCSMPWLSPSAVGKANTTRGAVGLSADDARWFYDHVAPGDTVEVVGSSAGGPSGAPPSP